MSESPFHLKKKSPTLQFVEGNSTESAPSNPSPFTAKIVKLATFPYELRNTRYIDKREARRRKRKAKQDEKRLMNELQRLEKSRGDGEPASKRPKKDGDDEEDKAELAAEDAVVDIEEEDDDYDLMHRVEDDELGDEDSIGGDGDDAVY